MVPTRIIRQHLNKQSTTPQDCTDRGGRMERVHIGHFMRRMWGRDSVYAEGRRMEEIHYTETRGWKLLVLEKSILTMALECMDISKARQWL